MKSSKKTESVRVEILRTGNMYTFGVHGLHHGPVTEGSARSIISSLANTTNGGAYHILHNAIIDGKAGFNVTDVNSALATIRGISGMGTVKEMIRKVRTGVEPAQVVEASIKIACESSIPQNEYVSVVVEGSRIELVNSNDQIFDKGENKTVDTIKFMLDQIVNTSNDLNEYPIVLDEIDGYEGLLANLFNKVEHEYRRLSMGSDRVIQSNLIDEKSWREKLGLS